MSALQERIFNILGEIQTHLSVLEEEHAEFIYTHAEAPSSSANSREPTPEPSSFPLTSSKQKHYDPS